jgi:GTPase SAR1 family protein
MTKTLILVINGKGGVGKSFFAINLVAYLKDRQQPHAAIDTDHENSTLKRFHPEATFVNLEQPQQADVIFERLMDGSLVVVDCRAASTDQFLGYFSEIQVFDILAELGATLTIVSPVNHEADGIEQIRVISQGLGNRCRYVIIRNQAHSDQFRLWDGSQTRKRVLEEYSGKEIVMPKLYPWLVTALNEHGVTVSAGTSHPAFNPIDRQRLKNWQRLFEEQIGVVTNDLFPATSPHEPRKSKKSATVATEEK